MTDIIEKYKLRPAEEQSITSKNARNFVKVIKLQQELEKEKDIIFRSLSNTEKGEVFEVISKQFNIPHYLTVGDASEIMGISPQMVRRHCSDGNLIAHQTLEGSGKWRISTEQLMDKPHWDEFIQKRSRIKEQSIHVAEHMLKYLNDEE